MLQIPWRRRILRSGSLLVQFPSTYPSPRPGYLVMFFVMPAFRASKTIASLVLSILPNSFWILWVIFWFVWQADDAETSIPCIVSVMEGFYYVGIKVDFSDRQFWSFTYSHIFLWSVVLLFFFNLKLVSGKSHLILPLFWNIFLWWHS